MASAIGELLIKLGLDATEYTSGLSKAEYLAQQSANRIKESLVASFAGNFGANLATKLTEGLAELPGRVAGIVKDAIDAADHLNDLSKTTGIAVETLGGLGFAAKQAGSDLDSVAQASVKLDKNIAAAAAGNKAQAAAFDAVGVSVRNAAGNVKSADAVLVELADKFAGYADGPNKAALAIALFGKAGASIIPLLNDGGKALQDNVEYFKQYSGVSAETASNADQFNDTLEKLHLLSGAFAQSLASELLPVLNVLAAKFLETKESGDQFRGAAADIVEIMKSVTTFALEAAFAFTQVGKAIGAFLAAMDQPTFSGFIAVAKDFGVQFKSAEANVNSFTDAINKAKKAASTATVPRLNVATGRDHDSSAAPKPEAPLIPAKTGGSKAAKDDPTKNLLNNQLKAIQDEIAQEKELLGARNRMLDLANSQNLLSITDYYNARQDNQKKALAGEIAGYDKEIAALTAYKNAKGTSQKDAAGADGKIEEAVRKRAKAQRDASEASVVLSVQEQQAIERLQAKFDTLTASVLVYREQFGKAAGIQFDVQNDALSKTFTAEGNKAALDALATLRAAAVAQGEFQQAATLSGRSYATLSQQEGALSSAVANGSSTTLDALARVGEARRAMIPVIEAQVAAEEAIARASGSAALVAQAEAARAALEQLKAASDPLADKFREIGVSATENFIDKLASGTVKLKDAFKGLADDIGKQFLKLAEQNIAESLFGKTGILGSVAPELSKVFTKGAGSGSGAGGIFGGVFGAAQSPGNGVHEPGTGALGYDFRPQPASGGGLFSSILGAFGLGGSSSGSPAAAQSPAVAANDQSFSALTATIGNTDTALGSLTTSASPLQAAFGSIASLASSTGGVFQNLLSGTGSGAAGAAKVAGAAGSAANDSGGGGFFGFISSLFGGGGGAAGAASGAAGATEAAATAAALTAVTTAASPLAAILGVLAEAATSAATALSYAAATASASSASSSGSAGAGIFASLLASSKGNVFNAGSAIPFRVGGVVNRKSFFGMADGRVGSMAENGPEAIMPLKRTATGDLGIAMDGGGSGGQTIHLHYYPAPDESRKTTAQRGAELFRQGQMASNRNS